MQTRVPIGLHFCVQDSCVLSVPRMGLEPICHFDVTVDFKSTAYTIPPPGHGRWCALLHMQRLEAQTGVEPVHSGFADRRVNHFATEPWCS